MKKLNEAYKDVQFQDENTGRVYGFNAPQVSVKIDHQRKVYTIDDDTPDEVLAQLVQIGSGVVVELDVESEEDVPNEGTKDWYIMKLEEAGAEFDPKAKKDDLKEFFEKLEEGGEDATT
ncbi:MAG: hypothetical protein AAF363_18735 [Bacteroidota bacterium]